MAETREAVVQSFKVSVFSVPILTIRHVSLWTNGEGDEDCDECGGEHETKCGSQE